MKHTEHPSSEIQKYIAYTPSHCTFPLVIHIRLQKTFHKKHCPNLAMAVSPLSGLIANFRNLPEGCIWWGWLTAWRRNKNIGNQASEWRHRLRGSHWSEEMHQSLRGLLLRYGRLSVGFSRTESIGRWSELWQMLREQRILCRLLGQGSIL